MKKALLLLGTVLPSSVRLMIWRLLGFRVGIGCRVAPFSIVVADDIELAHGAVIDTLCLIFTPSKLRLGERSRIASFNRIIGYGEVMLDRQNFIALGNLIEVSAGYRFVMGAISELGPRGTYYTHGASQMLFNLGLPSRRGDIIIGEDVWLGMCTVVYPKVKIGDRTLGFAGLTITSDLEGGQVLFPPSNAHKTMPIDRVKLAPGGSDRHKLERMKTNLETLRAAYRGSKIEKTERSWTLSPHEGQRVILLLEGDETELGGVGGGTIIWKLGALTIEAPVPTFCFSELTVYGGWTPFAERLAADLCDRCGAHFVFHSRSSQ